MVQLVIAQPKKGKGGRRDSVDRGGVHYDSDDSMASVELTGEQRDAQVARGLTVAPSFKVLSMHQLRSHMDSGNPMGSMDSLESMRRVSSSSKMKVDGGLENRDENDFERLRISIQELFEDPGSSTSAYWLAVGILILIILSSISFCAETVQAVQDNAFSIELIEKADYFFIAVFSLEYVVRLLVSGNMYEFAVTVPNLVDVVAILPFYVELLMSAVTGAGGGIDLRFLRLARVFRVFKLSRYGHRMQLIVDALQESREILLMLSVNLVILIVVFSSITYYAEKNEEDSAFSSIPATCWWCVVTVLTVGYGDMAPTSVAGKLIATILMFFSVLVMALPITIIGSSFSNSWMAYKDELKLSKRKETLPRRFREIFPALNTFCNEWTDYNDSFRESNHDLRSLNDEMQTALDQGDNDKMIKLLGRAEPIHLSVSYNLNSTLQWTSSAMETVLNDWTATATENRKHFKRGSELMERSTELLQRTAVQVVKGEDNDAANPGVLILHVLGGRQMPASDINGTSDPYVVFHQGDNGPKQQTEVVLRSLTPLFDEYKVLMLSNLREPIQFHVMDSDPYRDALSSSWGWLWGKLWGRNTRSVRPSMEPVGKRDGSFETRSGELMCRGSLPLTNLKMGVSKTLWVALADAKGEPAGELKISVLLKRTKDLSAEDVHNDELWPSLIETARDYGWLRSAVASTTKEASAKPSVTAAPGHASSPHTADDTARPPMPAPEVAEASQPPPLPPQPA